MSTTIDNMVLSKRDVIVNDDEEDRLLRHGNGIVDEIVFPRLRLMGFPEPLFHTVSMRWVRLVQSGRDPDGFLAEILDVVRCGVNGTRSRQPEF